MPNQHSLTSALFTLFYKDIMKKVKVKYKLTMQCWLSKKCPSCPELSLSHPLLIFQTLVQCYEITKRKSKIQLKNHNHGKIVYKTSSGDINNNIGFQKLSKLNQLESEILLFSSYLKLWIIYHTMRQCVTRSLFQFSRREREFLSFNLMFETRTRISFFQSRASRREREFLFSISGFETRTRIEIETILARIFENYIYCSFID